MLPLAGPNFPASLEEFIVALRTGFSGRGVAARDVRAAGEWPRLAELIVDLTGAEFTRAIELQKSAGEAQPGLSIETLAITARPFFFERTPIQLDLHAGKAACGFARDTAGAPLLQLLQTRSGSISIEARRADLEASLKSFAEEFLAKQGAQVKAARLELIDRGPRSLAFRAEITAKAFLMTARVEVTGQLDLDDQLNLRISHLATSGDGMIANLASAFLRPRFAEIEKSTISLSAYSFAGVTLHGAKISGGESLRIDGQFGA